MNNEQIIKRLAENRQSPPSRQYETVSLGEPSGRKAVKVSAEDKRKRDMLEDAKNAPLYPPDTDIFE